MIILYCSASSADCRYCINKYSVVSVYYIIIHSIFASIYKVNESINTLNTSLYLHKPYSIKLFNIKIPLYLTVVNLVGSF